MRARWLAGLMCMASVACGEDTSTPPDDVTDGLKDGSDGDESDGSNGDGDESDGSAGDGDGDGSSSGDGDGSNGDGSNGDGDGDSSPAEPQCVTHSLTNAVAGEKTNAAFCVGMAYDDTYSCQFDPLDNTVYCPGANSGYYVVFTGSDYGTIYDAVDGTQFALVEQSYTGEFTIYWDGAQGECTVVGDVATLCVTFD